MMASAAETPSDWWAVRFSGWLAQRTNILANSKRPVDRYGAGAIAWDEAVADGGNAILRRWS